MKGLAYICIFSAAYAVAYADDCGAVDPDGACDQVSYLQRAAASPPGQRHGKRTVTRLQNNQDLEYTGTLTVGGQEVRAVFDTGSFELVVMSKWCRSSACSNSGKYYDYMKSTNYESLTFEKTMNYGSGDVDCELTKDTLTIGENSWSTAFWLGTTSTLDILEEGTFDAILGLSHPREPQKELEHWIIEDERLLNQCEAFKGWLCDLQTLNKSVQDQNELLQTLITNPAPLEMGNVVRFSMCFLKPFQSEGYMIWHDYKAETLHGFRRIPVTGHVHWSTNFSNFRVEGDDANALCVEPQCNVLLDTGTSLFTASEDAVDRLRRQLHITQASCDNLDRYPNLVFNMHGEEYSLPPSAYIGYLTGEIPTRMRGFFKHLDDRGNGTSKFEMYCQLLFMGADMDSYYGFKVWIMGIPWFRHFYTTFDFGEDGNYDTRSMHVAPANPRCEHPSAPGFAASLHERQPQKARVVDLSRVRVSSLLSRWATKREKVKL